MGTRPGIARHHHVVAGICAGLFWMLAPLIGHSQPPPGECPQHRFTGKAPDEYFNFVNPLTGNSDKAVERLYLGKAGNFGCANCHGTKGDGKGPMAKQFDPRPRNFACAQTVTGIPDGQLFWIIRFGSPGTAMPSHPDFTDRQVWELVAYLRHLAK